MSINEVKYMSELKPCIMTFVGISGLKLEVDRFEFSHLSPAVINCRSFGFFFVNR